MIERTLEEMVADVEAAMRLTKSELGRALARKGEAKNQAAACRVKFDELEERLSVLKMRTNPERLFERLRELDITDPVLDPPEIQPPAPEPVAMAVPGTNEDDDDRRF